MTGEARAQSPSGSPFQPSLTDPRHVGRFTAPDRSPKITPATIAPPSGAGETGFDSTGAPGKKKKIKKKSGAPHPLPLPPPRLPGPPQAASGHGGAPQIKVRAAYADVYKPLDAPVRRPLPVGDPYEPTGVHVGSFLLRPSIEVTRGYDSNPLHGPEAKPSGFTTLAPELHAQSLWDRHEFRADLRGSYSNYDKASSLNAPLVDGKAFTRFDVSRDTKINMENRVFVSTDYPGSPNLPIGFARLPTYVAYGTTLGVTQSINHLELTAKASADQTKYQNTELIDGEKSSNQDRDYTQYGGAVRAGYEVFPGVKPFVEVGADTRRHDLQFDRDGYQRDSTALMPKVGTTFEITKKLTGELSVGYLARHFEDARLQDLRGIIFDGTLKWEATGLTTATLTATSRGDETVVAGWSGALRRDVGVQVDHMLRRWLIWTVRAGYGSDDYVGSDRADTRMSLGSALTYKFNRDLSLKGEYRYDQLRSNVPGVSYNANVFLVGLKLQR